MREKTKLNTLITTLDSAIKEGKGSQVRTQLLKLRPSKIPPELRLSFAAIARRVDLSQFALRVLHPVIWPAKGAKSQATEEERAEYGINLIRVGAVSEGMALLKEVDTDKNPQALLFLGAGYIAEWNHEDAIPFLKKGMESSGLSDYQNLTCAVNLCGALVHEQRYKEAATLFDKLIVKTENSQVLYGNMLKYGAELKIESGDFKGAEKFLNEAEKVFEQFGGRDTFLIRKWKSLLLFLTKPESKEANNAMKSVENEAIETGYYETRRDFDYYRARITRDPEIFERLYFGTPFKSYRERILKEWKTTSEISEQYNWELKSGAKNPLPLLLGEKLPNGSRLKVGQAMHRLLCVLASDFYRPIKLAPLFATLFPEKHYNPDSSPIRVHAVIHRFRAWLKKNQIPLVIHEQDGGYSIKAEMGCTLIVPKNLSLMMNPMDGRLLKLQKQFPGTFSIKEAREYLGISSVSAWRILSQGIQEGLLTSQGENVHTRYSFSTALPVKKAA